MHVSIGSTAELVRPQDKKNKFRINESELVKTVIRHWYTYMYMHAYANMAMVKVCEHC